MAFVRSDGIPSIIVSLYADYDSGEINLQNSMSDFAWVSFEESKNYDLIEGIYEELKMLDSYFKSGIYNEWHK